MYKEVRSQPRNGHPGPTQWDKKQLQVSKIYLWSWIFQFQTKLSAPGRLNRHYTRKCWTIDFLQQIAESVQNHRSVSTSKSARIELIFCVVVAISLSFSFRHIGPSSSLYSETRCAQTRPLFQIVRTMRFCAKYVTEQNDASEWMGWTTASVEWYLSPGSCLNRSWKSIEVVKQFSQKNMSLSETGNVNTAQYVVVVEML